MPAQEDRTSSRLVARLREITRGAATPLGFGRAPAKKQPSLLLIVYGTPDESDLLRAAASAGADAIVGRIDDAATDLTAAVVNLQTSAGSVPLGIEIVGSLDASQLGSLAVKGVDFVAFEPHRTADDVLEIAEIGRIARLILDHHGSILRGLNDLPVDAIEIEVDRPSGSINRLTVYDIADLRQVVDAIRRPVIFIAPAGFSPGDLKRLREMGVEAVALDAHGLGEDVATVSGRVSALRAAIDALGPSIGRGRTHEGRRVFLPTMRTEEPAGDEEEDDDEE